ncbi:MAG: hypothetical protein AAF747_00405 [Planctomycetota bacterium]
MPSAEHVNAMIEAGGERLASRLRDMIGRQTAAFEQLDVLSQRQAAMIEARDADALLGLLGERQVLVDEITGIGEELGPFRERWDAVLGRLSPAERAAVGDDIQSLQDLASKVAERDAADRSNLERERDETAKRLSGVAQGRAAVAAYGTPGRPGAQARFQDREG